MMIHDTPAETTAYQGRIGEVIQTKQPDGRIFERYRRAPGTRIVIVSKDNKILITKERRDEANGLDLRLPGGKVRDSLDEYHQLLQSTKGMREAAKEAAKKEAIEETGIDPTALQFLVKATAGATVEWDLYYFIVREYTELEHGQQLEHGEDIEVTWMTPDEIRLAVSRGEIQEWRSVGVLLGLVFPMLQQSGA